MTGPAASDFLATFRARKQLCAALLELSRRQRALIDADDYTQLLVVLGQKQRILGRLEELKGREPDLLERWQAERDGLESTTRAECDQALAETETILADLAEEENDATQHLAQRRDETRRELEALAQGSEVHDAYRDSLAPATHRHLDVDR